MTDGLGVLHRWPLLAMLVLVGLFAARPVQAAEPTITGVMPAKGGPLVVWVSEDPKLPRDAQPPPFSTRWDAGASRWSTPATPPPLPVDWLPSLTPDGVEPPTAPEAVQQMLWQGVLTALASREVPDPLKNHLTVVRHIRRLVVIPRGTNEMWLVFLIPNRVPRCAQFTRKDAQSPWANTNAVDLNQLIADIFSIPPGQSHRAREALLRGFPQPPDLGSDAEFWSRWLLQSSQCSLPILTKFDNTPGAVVVERVEPGDFAARFPELSAHGASLVFGLLGKGPDDHRSDLNLGWVAVATLLAFGLLRHARRGDPNPTTQGAGGTDLQKQPRAHSSFLAFLRQTPSGTDNPVSTSPPPPVNGGGTGTTAPPNEEGKATRPSTEGTPEVEGKLSEGDLAALNRIANAVYQAWQDAPRDAIPPTESSPASAPAGLQAEATHDDPAITEAERLLLEWLRAQPAVLTAWRDQYRKLEGQLSESQNTAARVPELEIRARNLATDLEKLQVEAAKLTTEREAASTTSTFWERRAKRDRTALQESRAALLAHASVTERLRAELDSAWKDLEQARQELEEEKRNPVLQQEAASERQRAAAAAAELAALQAQWSEKWETETARWETEIARWQEQLAAARQNQEATLAAWEREQEILRSERDNLRASLTQSQEAARNWENTAGERQKELDARTELAKGYWEQLQTEADTIKKWRASYEQLSEQLEQLQQSHESAKQKIAQQQSFYENVLLQMRGVEKLGEYLRDAEYNLLTLSEPSNVMEVTSISAFLLNYSLARLGLATVLQQDPLRIAMLANLDRIAEVFGRVGRFDAVRTVIQQLEPNLPTLAHRLARDSEQSPLDRGLFQEMLRRLERQNYPVGDFNYAVDGSGRVIFTG